MARSSVLLPDMFEPVTSSSVPGGPTRTSLLTRRRRRAADAPSDVGIEHARAPVRSIGHAPVRVVAADCREQCERVELADRFEPVAHGAGPAFAATARARRRRGSPRASAPGSENGRSPAERRSSPNPRIAIQPPHALGRLLPAGRQPIVKLRKTSARYVAPSPRAPGRRHSARAPAARRRHDRATAGSCCRARSESTRPQDHQGEPQRAPDDAGREEQQQHPDAERERQCDRTQQRLVSAKRRCPPPTPETDRSAPAAPSTKGRRGRPAARATRPAAPGPPPLPAARGSPLEARESGATRPAGARLSLWPPGRATGRAMRARTDRDRRHTGVRRSDKAGGSCPAAAAPSRAGFARCLAR